MLSGLGMVVCTQREAPTCGGIRLYEIPKGQTPTFYAEEAEKYEEMEMYSLAAKYWDAASNASMGQQRADRYREAAARCRKMHYLEH